MGKEKGFAKTSLRTREVRRWLDNYQKLKESIEAICELNHELLRPEPHRRRSGGRHD